MLLPLLFALGCSGGDNAADIATKPTAEAGGPSSVAGIPEQRTASGLKSWVLKEGSGPQAQVGNTVDVHYTGWLKSNGKEFDSSRGGDPLSFTIGQGRVIAGWEEGIALMKVGEKRQLEIPPELGYGDAGIGPIPGGATLVFDVELVGVR